VRTVVAVGVGAGANFNSNFPVALSITTRSASMRAKRPNPGTSAPIRYNALVPSRPSTTAKESGSPTATPAKR